MKDIVLSIPFVPPTENKIKVIRVIRGRPGGLAYTKEATNYRKKFKQHIRDTYLIDIQRFVSTHTDYSTYTVNFVFHFPKDSLVNKGWPKTKTYYKKMDVGNRRKLLEDCVSEVLGIDDSRFFSVKLTKRFLEDNIIEPYVTIRIWQYKDDTIWKEHNE